jgi:ABC-type bacteriocin/lantibiotic exporter with double-glycine peptidase domain
MVAAFSTLLMFWFGTGLVLRGEGHLAIGQLVTFVQWSMLVYPPIERIVGLFSRFQAFSIGVDRLNMVLDTPAEVTQAPVAGPALPGGSWEVKVEGVSFSYAEDQPNILSDISFEASSGQMVAVVGRSGAGKTTLINLLMRFYEPGAGQILLNGTDIRQFGLSDYRSQVGVTSARHKSRAKSCSPPATSRPTAWASTFRVQVLERNAERRTPNSEH